MGRYYQDVASKRPRRLTDVKPYLYFCMMFCVVVIKERLIFSFIYCTENDVVSSDGIIFLSFWDVRVYDRREISRL